MTEHRFAIDGTPPTIETAIEILEGDLVFMSTIQPQVYNNINPRFVVCADNSIENQPMVKTVGQIIKEALTRMGKPQSWLAEQIGISNNAVSKWIKTGKISRENIPKAARLLGLYPDELLPDFDSIYHAHGIPITHNVDYGPDIKGRVPLISWVQAGNWTEVIDELTPDAAEEWFPCPVPHSDKTFVLYVRGESMFNPSSRPSFNDGDLIFVDPERQAHHRSLIVVRLDDNKEATFKQLVIEGDNKYLKALNPAWPGQMIPINGNATICGVVIFKGEKL